MSCLQEARLIGQSSGMLGIEGRSYMLWLSTKGDGVGHVEVIEKEQPGDKVVEVRWINDRLVAFEKDVLSMICEYALPNG